MNLAEKIAITGAMFFLLIGLLTGIWKYWSLARSKDGVAPVYVDVLHRATLLYSFASGVIYLLAGLSAYDERINVICVIAVLSFFVFANIPYLVHAFLNDTDNQFRQPYKLANWAIPKILFHGFMFALIAAELGGTVVLSLGALKNIWQ